MNVMSNPPPFLFGGIRSQIVKQSDVLKNRRDVINQLQDKLYIRTIKPVCTANYIEASDVTVIYRYRKIGPSVQGVGYLVATQEPTFGDLPGLKVIKKGPGGPDFLVDDCLARR